ncbi:hypothetical protein HRS9139_02432 [Pyrenophora teres f. teres]|uniref:Uncharacterized protein n=1 Tax=Pyrenophora teres f. teres TaxID=97479 RepID=A0A6S6VSC6_9PLEO|nr:hypothetical protein HRS9139_02432 [Pyrenophora teres f. teres]KAE8870837.1 hypothetical protein PTNB29_01181 [Pyrenophora teres f. teres]CAE7014840.1 hypothetical protein PTTW11_02712 [Pyrenophora teres f. teres]
MLPSRTMAPSVALMVQRIELSHVPIDVHVEKAPLHQQHATTQVLPFCPTPLWSNGSPSIPNFSRPRPVKQSPDVLRRTKSSSTASPEVAQKASPSVAPKEDGNSQMLEVKRKHPFTRSKVESESSDESDANQSSDHPVNWPLVDAGLWFSGQQKMSTTLSTPTRQKSLSTVCTPVNQTPSPAVCTPVRRSSSIKIKMESTSPTPAMIEKPRGSVSAVTTKPGFPILVSSRLAEQYYRSIVDNDDLYAQIDISSGWSRRNSSKPILADTKEEEEEEKLTTTEAGMSRLVQEFENLIKSTVKIEKTSPTPSPPPHGNLDTIEPYNTLHTQTLHQPTALSPSLLKQSAPPSLKPPSSPVPPSLLSFLKPPTPTPFSTSHGIPNNAPYAPNLHLIPGSILEQQKRPTEWGRQHRKRTDKPKYRRVPQTNNIHGPIVREYRYRSAESLLQGQARKIGRLCAVFKRTVMPMRKRRKGIEAPPLLGSFLDSRFSGSRVGDGVWWKESVVWAPDAFVGERRTSRWWQVGSGRSNGRIWEHEGYQATLDEDEVSSMMVNVDH